VKRAAASVIYWDTSAVLATLFRDEHSGRAVPIARTDSVHLLSSLTWAETHAVIARLERERMLATTLTTAARDAFVDAHWRRVNLGPDWQMAESLAQAWPLRGADLWHLATAKTLQADLPELTFLSFDARLVAAAIGEGLRQPSGLRTH
jgi:predicted nucleic acid-binding protein